MLFGESNSLTDGRSCFYWDRGRLARSSAGRRVMISRHLNCKPYSRLPALEAGETPAVPTLRCLA
jgi:hypothetical protein